MLPTVANYESTTIPACSETLHVTEQVYARGIEKALYLPRGIISTSGNKEIEEISRKYPLEIRGMAWVHHDLEIYSTLRSM